MHFQTLSIPMVIFTIGREAGHPGFDPNGENHHWWRKSARQTDTHLSHGSEASWKTVVVHQRDALEHVGQCLLVSAAQLNGLPVGRDER